MAKTVKSFEYDGFKYELDATSGEYKCSDTSKVNLTSVPDSPINIVYSVQSFKVGELSYTYNSGSKVYDCSETTKESLTSVPSSATDIVYSSDVLSFEYKGNKYTLGAAGKYICSAEGEASLDEVPKVVSNIVYSYDVKSFVFEENTYAYDSASKSYKSTAEGTEELTSIPSGASQIVYDYSADLEDKVQSFDFESYTYTYNTSTGEYDCTDSSKPALAKVPDTATNIVYEDEYVPAGVDKAQAQQLVTLELDTVAPVPTVEINGGALYSSSKSVKVRIISDSPDVVGAIIYGDIADSSAYGKASEDDASKTENIISWVTGDTEATFDVDLDDTADGAKTISVKLIDDVGNVTPTAVSETITLDTKLPIVYQTKITPSKISLVEGHNAATLVFFADSDITEYKVAVVSDNSVSADIATALEGCSAVANYAANTGIKVTVKGTALKAAVVNDGVYTLKVFVKDAAGNWSE